MISIRLANSSDNEQLLDLTALTPMAGRIAIRTDRDPDFFSLLSLRGEYKVLVAEIDSHIIGCFSVSVIPYFYKQEPVMLYYMGDLKVHPDQRSGSVAFRLVNEMKLDFEVDEKSFLYCNIAYGNSRVEPFFGGRVGFTTMSSIGHFNVYQVIPSVSRPSRIGIVEESRDVNALKVIYEKKKEHYDLFPQPRSEHLSRCTHFVVHEEERIKGAISLFDPGHAKQNVLLALPPLMRIFVESLRWFNRLFHFTNLPGYNEPMKILYVSYFSYDTGDETTFKSLLDKAKDHAYQHGYVFLSIGIHQDDAANSLMKRYRKFVFKSVGLCSQVLFNGTGKKSSGTITAYEDFSLV